MSGTFREFCASWKIQHVHTTAYHPQTNGACELFNGTIKTRLQRLMDGKELNEWDTIVSAAVFSYNTTLHSQTGYTPFYMMFGSEARVPVEMIVTPSDQAVSEEDYVRELAERLQDSYQSVRSSGWLLQKREKEMYDSRAVVANFKTGELVRIRLGKVGGKLDPVWSAPHKVKTVFGVNVQLEEPGNPNLITIHHDRLANGA